MHPATLFSQVQAVLFDLDGTLIDSAPDLAAAADAMRVARGLPSLPLAQYRPMAGAGARGLLGVAFGMTPEHADYETLREEFFCNYERSLTQRTGIFNGVPELLESFAIQGVKWGVVTNKSERFTLPLTGAMPLFATAGAIVSGDTTPHAKPHPEPLLEAARRLGVDASRCVYVGDDERDIVAGLAAGMATVAVTYGYLGAQADTSRWGANATINCVNELLPLLQFSSVA
ncbi:HAD family hydrolase [Rhodoferax sp.]|jgi:phosphoglycolate phosphatase|uniref:HAD family hydrolase n=1 Tax=Rhodoferax sp. TaxID=50421 RepID=UPI002730632C|nr:HAD-IA family hydrolase [Rhodoferax sp.]MDP1531221.1 HAD-IA family hydrolase [Rhodoferax sp.]MDP1942271.1 HAD-IA family hydrolase [Rhodoferax sp.]MDP2441291.1 HAD-IA family hydrolase [Rhodoferax sp.]MDZ4207948.1 HAD-IA family hydrolase [Rhodoferax sp.]